MSVALLPFLEVCWGDVGNPVDLSQAAAHVAVFRRPEHPHQLLGHVDSTLQYKATAAQNHWMDVQLVEHVPWPLVSY